MTSGTTVRLEPVVGWPRAMRPGRPYLIEVDLRLADGDWPYDEEEFAFTCLLDGSSSVTVEAVHDASVVLHRFGGSYGPAEFVVTPYGEPGRRSLWLTIVTERGVAVRAVELPVDIHQTTDDGYGGMATTTRPVRATVPARPSAPRRAQDVASDPPWCLLLLAEIVRYAVRTPAAQLAAGEALNQVVRSACQVVGIDPSRCVFEVFEGGLQVILPAGLDADTVGDELITGLQAALAEINAGVATTDRFRLRIVLSEGEAHGNQLLVQHWELGSSDRIPGVDQVPVPADTYPTLSLHYADRPEEFLQLVRDQVDRHADLLYVTGGETAVLVSDPGDGLSEILDRLQRTVESWGPSCAVRFESYTFRPYALQDIRITEPGRWPERLATVPATVRVRELATMANHDVDAVRVVKADAYRWVRRLPGGYTLHDAGLRDRARVLLLTGELREDIPGATTFDNLLSLPNVHLVINGDNVAAIGYGDLPQADRRAQVLANVADLAAARTLAEVSCVFGGSESTIPVEIRAPRGVRVLFSRPSESAHELVKRLAEAETVVRDVVVVSAEWERADALQENLWLVSPFLLLRSIDPTAYEAAGRNTAIPPPIVKREPAGSETARRSLHFVLLLDRSGSMAMDGKIGALNTAVREAIRETRLAAESARVEVMVRAVAFASGAWWHVREPTPAGDLRWSDLEAAGGADLGAALRLVAAELEVSPSILVLVSDGLPTDDWRSGLHALNDSARGRQSGRIAIAVGSDAEETVLREFLGNPELDHLLARSPRQLTAALRWAARTAVQNASIAARDVSAGLSWARPVWLGTDEVVW